jgi:hypothetical protein
MRNSKLVKHMFMVLPVLAVLGAAVLGLLFGNNLNPLSLGSGSTSVQFGTESNTPQLLPMPEAAGSCMPSAIYTSFPPKCKTLEGEFIPVPGSSPYLFAMPERK